MSIQVQRLLERPIITPDMDESLGGNINGPSLIKVPEWLDNPLGKYYLYFAHHSGKFIRMAYSDQLEGPWHIYKQGTLQLASSYCRGHIASPDVHIDEANRRIIMFYHGVPQEPPGNIPQETKVALSSDGLHFTASADSLGWAYWRSFQWGSTYYGITMPGNLYRSTNWLGPYQAGADLFRDINVWQRHPAVKIHGSTLYLFYSIKEDKPEHIVMSRIPLTDNWLEWRVTSYESVLMPELLYEGADLPLEPSRTGAIHTRVRQLRDPGIFEEDGDTYLLYSIAGESGLAIARIAGFD
jgi:hypothetical protein